MRMLLAILLFLCAVAFALRPHSVGAQSRQDTMDRVQFGSKLYDNHRELTYWGNATLSLRNYHHGTEDADRLKLLAPAESERFSRRPSADLQSHFNAEFNRLFGDLPFHDLSIGSDERFNAFWNQYKDLPPGERADRWRAAEAPRAGPRPAPPRPPPRPRYRAATGWRRDGCPRPR